MNALDISGVAYFYVFMFLCNSFYKLSTYYCQCL